MPRHPPCALHSLSHTTTPHHPPTGGRTRQAMHTTRHKRTTHPTPQSQGQVRKKQKETHHTHTPENNRVRPGASPDARVHYPDLKQQPHTRHRRPTAPTAQQGGAEAQPPLTGRSDPSEPQHCVADETAWSFHIPKQHQSHHTNPADTAPAGGGELSVVLLRKEVIQPHLPVRLPCYDFVPIASPTFDHSLQQAGWAVGFGCCRLS